jgi:hypothetical protein
VTTVQPAAATRWRPDEGALRYGIRMGAAVLLAFGASALLRLPEGYWAVMSALIIVRRDAGGTLGAGWDRIRGVLVGTGLGLLGAVLRHHAAATDAMGLAPLLLVTVLAFAAGLTPALRSAPISALIVVTSGGVAGHSPGEVALLRALEIGLGIGAALIVSLADRRSRATSRFRVAAAAHLRGLADALATEASRPGRGDDDGDDRRAALRRLAILADAADREMRVFGLGREPSGGADRHRRSARLLARIGNDAALFERLRAIGSPAGRGEGDRPGATPPKGTVATGPDPLQEPGRTASHKTPTTPAIETPADSAPDAPVDARQCGAEAAAATRLRAFAEALERVGPFEWPSRQGAASARDGEAGAQVVVRLLEADLLALGRLEGLRGAGRSRVDHAALP